MLYSKNSINAKNTNNYFSIGTLFITRKKSDQSDQSKEEVRSIEGEFLGDSCCKYKNIDTDWINTLRVYLLQVRTDVNI